MNKEDIKVGETYYVRVKVTAKSENRFECRPLFSGGTMSNFAPNFFNFVEAEAFYMSRPETTPPKYDPCRKFRKGDEVRVIEWNGRTSMRDGMVALVVKNEENGGMVEVSIDGWKNGGFYHACKLELVTPVEEREPYSVEAHEGGECGRFEVMRRKQCVSIYPYGSLETRYYKKAEHAKAAAEAERDRLNAEHRKEMGNG